MALRVACIGTGGIAARHLDALRQVPGVEVVGISGRDEARAAAFARRHETRPFTDWRRLLDEARPEAVFVCVTPAGHGAIEEELVARALPFFVEKPLALDWETAARIADGVARAGIVTAVGYQWRYLSGLERAAEALERHRAGLVYGHWLTVTPAPAWWSDGAQSGGQILEQATHVFDLARHLVGEIREVYARTARVERAAGRRGDVDDACAATVTFASGAVGSFQCTHLLPASYRVGLHLFCDGAAVEVTATEVTIDRGREKVEHRHEGDATLRQDRAFVEAVRAGRRDGVLSPYADALRTHRVTTRVVESARTGAPLAVEP